MLQSCAKNKCCGAAVLAFNSANWRRPSDVREAPRRGISCSQWRSLYVLYHVLVLLLPDVSGLSPAPTTNPEWNFPRFASVQPAIHWYIHFVLAQDWLSHHGQFSVFNPEWNFSPICFSPASYTLVYSLRNSPRLAAASWPVRCFHS